MGQYAAKLVLLKVTAIRGVWLDAAANRANDITGPCLEMESLAEKPFGAIEN